MDDLNQNPSSLESALVAAMDRWLAACRDGATPTEDQIFEECRRAAKELGVDADEPRIDRVARRMLASIDASDSVPSEELFGASATFHIDDVPRVDDDSDVEAGGTRAEETRAEDTKAEDTNSESIFGADATIQNPSAPGWDSHSQPTVQSDKIRDCSTGKPSAPSGFMDDVTQFSPIAPAPRTSPGPSIGELIHNKYRVKRCIGWGGFGAVYEAEDERGAGNVVAIKVLHGQAARSAIQLESFREEARRITRLNHPNIVDWKVFDVAEDGTPYFVMELLDGEELHNVLKREKQLPFERAANILLQILSALRAAHNVSARECILHLDLKPKNVFVTPPRHDLPEAVKVIDFGIGQHVDSEAEPPNHAAAPERPSDAFDPGPINTLSSDVSSSSSTGVQRTSACTPEYASPEHAKHVLGDDDIVPLDGRADLYSLGVIGFQMLTGQLPFAADRRDRRELLREYIDTPRPSVSSAGVRVPRKLARFVDRCLEVDRDDRFESTDEAFEVLSAIVHPPVWKMVAAVTVPLVLLAALLGGWVLSSREVPEVRLWTAQNQNLETAPLYLGVERPLQRVRIEAPPESGVDLTGPWYVVTTNEPREKIAGVTVTQVGGSWVVESSTFQPGYEERRVQLELGDAEARSHPFTLGALGEKAWSLDEIRLAGRPVAEFASRALSPAGLGLELVVDGPARSIVSGARARVGDSPWVPFSEAPSADRRRFSLQLDELGIAAGDHQVTVEVLDPTGASTEREFAIRAVHGALSVDSLAIADAASGRALKGFAGRILVTSNVRPELVAELNRVADTTITVTLDGASKPIVIHNIEGRSRFRWKMPELSTLADGASFSASINVEVSESRYVHHGSAGLGVAESSLDLGFDPTALEVGLRVAVDGEALNASDRRYHISSGDVEVQVFRASDLPTYLELEIEGISDGSTVLTDASLAQLSTRDVEFPLELLEDGEYTVTLRAHRFDPTSQLPAETPDSTIEVTIVRDRIPPKLRLVGLEAPLFTDIRELDAPIEAMVSGEESTSIRWAVSGPGATRSGTQVYAAAQLTGGAATVDIERPWQSDVRRCDGRYRLSFDTTDAAGNSGARVEREFEVAIHGPAVEIEEPAGVGRWHPSPTQEWPVRLRVTDPNGVSHTSVDVELAGSAGESLRVELRPEPGSSPEEKSLVGSVLLPYEWSERRVVLNVNSEDRHGRRSETSSREIELPTIRRRRPERIAVTVGGQRANDLILVKGNPSFSYLFGGRGDRIENELFRLAGRPPFHPNPRQAKPRSWQLEFPPGAIEDFYLDEREVTIEQFLVFVKAAYDAPDSWPVGTRPGSTTRRDELLSTLQGTEVRDTAVTGITWDEAAAYAHWVGKRLPSFVEWEYAVRGGALYRPHADYTESTSEESVVSEPAIRGLSSGVAEWTSSPHSERIDQPHASTRVLAALFRDAFLGREPLDGQSESRVWVVGVEHPQDRVDFTVVGTRVRSTGGSNVGFRCATSLSQVEEGMRQLEGARFEEIKP